MVLTVPMGVGFAEFGGTIVPAALWITVAHPHARGRGSLAPSPA